MTSQAINKAHVQNLENMKANFSEYVRGSEQKYKRIIQELKCQLKCSS